MKVCSVSNLTMKHDRDADQRYHTGSLCIRLFTYGPCAKNLGRNCNVVSL